MENILSESLSAAGLKAKYDQACKLVLSNKQILARILKRCVPEYKDCTYVEIEGYIEGEPEVSRTPVRSDYSRISGSPWRGELRRRGTRMY